MSSEDIVLYIDGECRFCQGCATCLRGCGFVGKIQTQQSDCLSARLFVNGFVYTNSDAILVACLFTRSKLVQECAVVLFSVPKCVRDLCYRFVARIRWFL